MSSTDAGSSNYNLPDNRDGSSPPAWFSLEVTTKIEILRITVPYLKEQIYERLESLKGKTLNEKWIRIPLNTYVDGDLIEFVRTKDIDRETEELEEILMGEREIREALRRLSLEGVNKYQDEIHFYLQLADPKVEPFSPLSANRVLKYPTFLFHAAFVSLQDRENNEEKMFLLLNAESEKVFSILKMLEESIEELKHRIRVPTIPRNLPSLVCSQLNGGFRTVWHETNQLPISQTGGKGEDMDIPCDDPEYLRNYAIGMGREFQVKFRNNLLSPGDPRDIMLTGKAIRVSDAFEKRYGGPYRLRFNIRSRAYWLPIVSFMKENILPLLSVRPEPGQARIDQY